MTSTEVDIPSLDIRGANDNSLPAEPPDEFLTLEELFNMTRVEQLRNPTLAVLQTRFSPQAVREAMIGFDMMADLHFGRKRRNGAEEGTHPALVGLMDLFANPDLTVDELVTDYLHDVIEDCGDIGVASARHVGQLLILRNYPQARADAIAVGVEGLTRDDRNDQEGYLRKITTFETIVPSLRLGDRKLADTTHTVLSYSREIQDPQSSAKAQKYINQKAFGVLTLGEEANPHSPNTKRLRQAIIGCNDVIAEQNQNDHASRSISAPHILFTARVRV